MGGESSICYLGNLSSRLVKYLFTTITLLLLFISCNDERPPFIPADVDTGDDYMLSSGWCGTPPVPPVASLDGNNNLQIGVSYSGGCETHEFDLNYTQEGSMAYIWLVHDSHDDLCEAIVWDWLVFPLPEALRSLTSDLHIIDPQTKELIQVVLQDNNLRTAQGMVKYIDLEGGFYGLITDYGDQLDPLQSLPSELRVDSLRVWFSYKISEDQGSYHMWGTNIDLIDIWKL